MIKKSRNCNVNNQTHLPHKLVIEKSTFSRESSSPVHNILCKQRTAVLLRVILLSFKALLSHWSIPGRQSANASAGRSPPGAAPHRPTASSSSPRLLRWRRSRQHRPCPLGGRAGTTLLAARPPAAQAAGPGRGPSHLWSQVIAHARKDTFQHDAPIQNP